jgi:hypothetical protein
MILKCIITDENISDINITQDLDLRAKNTNVMDCFFFDEEDLFVDITGATIFFTVKNLPSDSDTNAVLKKDITSLTEPTSGEAEIELTPTDTSSLLGNYLYSIKIKLSSGKIYTVREGNVCFKKEISERTS